MFASRSRFNSSRHDETQRMTLSALSQSTDNTSTACEVSYREYGALFAPEMSAAMIANSKTKTRRIVKLPPTPQTLDGWERTEVGGKDVTDERGRNVPLHAAVLHLPTGQCIGPPMGMPGDRIWVRETHYAWGRWVRDGVTSTGKEKLRFVRDPAVAVRFRVPADGVAGKRITGYSCWHKRSSLFLCRADARLLLEITDIDVERLQDICEADAVAEGFAADFHNSVPRSAVDAFRALWCRIHGTASWAENPLVWVVSFRRLMEWEPA